jgi:hypothetical protein
LDTLLIFRQCRRSCDLYAASSIHGVHEFYGRVTHAGRKVLELVVDSAIIFERSYRLGLRVSSVRR